ncbi:hypothetical protein TNCV_2189931 [Trichonephila clavipes]|nr:hypothetical protein TNCV_2189931 [Trichonephila clavipes]
MKASKADLQSESTMMPSELAIFVRVRYSLLLSCPSSEEKSNDAEGLQKGCRRLLMNKAVDGLWGLDLCCGD